LTVVVKVDMWWPTRLFELMAVCIDTYRQAANLDGDPTDVLKAHQVSQICISKEVRQTGTRANPI
jgi:hypothetical protein